MTHPSAKHIVIIIGSHDSYACMRKVLAAIDDNFTVPILYQQPISLGMWDLMSGLMAQKTNRKVYWAERHMPIQNNALYLCPIGYRFVIKQKGVIDLALSGSIYSNANYCLESIAKVYGDKGVAVMLCPVGKEVKYGLQMFASYGGTILLKQTESLFPEMPIVIPKAHSMPQITPLEKIGAAINKYSGVVKPSSLTGDGAQVIMSQKLKDLLDYYLQLTLKYHQTNMGEVTLLQPKTGYLSLAVTKGITENMFQHFLQPNNIKGSPHIAAIQSKRPVIIENTQHMEPEKKGPLYCKDYKALQTTPFCNAEGKVLGTLSTYFNTPHKFTTHEISKAIEVAGMLSNAVSTYPVSCS